MPRLPTLRTRVLQELARQLRFESTEAARRQLVRAEELALQLLEEQSKGVDAATPEGYPEEWVVFRITGLRTEPESADGGHGASIVVREALLGDLPALIDRLSAAARIGPEDLGAKERWLGVRELCARWKVSRKTVERYRRLGLVSRRVSLGSGRERVVYAERAVRAFERVRSGRIVLAGTFDRMDEATRGRIVRRAARYRSRLGWSMHRCAQRLAAREGRSAEAIRRVLLKHDAGTDRPIFDVPGVLDAEGRAWVARQSARGGNMTAAAARVRKSRATAYRSVQGIRASRLRELDLRGPVGPLFERKDAPEVLLASDPARAGLGGPGPRGVPELLMEAAGQQAEPAGIEVSRGAAYWYLVWLARRGVEALPRHGARVRGELGTLDTIETRLLWASRLKAEAVRSQLALLVRTVESQTARKVETIPPGALREALEVGLEALVDAVERFDPFKGGRLAAPAGLGVARAISAWVRRGGTELLGPPGRAVARVDAAHAGVTDFTRRVHPWQEWLEPPAGVRERLAELGERERRTLELRLGWDGGPPRTLTEAASELGTTPTRIAAMQRRATAMLAHGAVGKGGRR